MGNGCLSRVGAKCGVWVYILGHARVRERLLTSCEICNEWGGVVREGSVNEGAWRIHRLSVEEIDRVLSLEYLLALI